MSGKICDACGTEKYIAGVASSGLGPVSFCFCSTCIGMRAEPLDMIEALVESIGGIDKVGEKVGLTYYDDRDDCYRDYRTKQRIPIRTKDELEFKTKEEFYNHLKSKETKNDEKK